VREEFSAVRRTEAAEWEDAVDAEGRDAEAAEPEDAVDALDVEVRDAEAAEPEDAEDAEGRDAEAAEPEDAEDVEVRDAEAAEPDPEAAGVRAARPGAPEALRDEGADVPGGRDGPAAGAGPAPAMGLSAGSSGRPVRTARRTRGRASPPCVSGPEGGATTPRTRPDGADGSTACPIRPPTDGFCHVERWERNRMPSLTPTAERATNVTGGGVARQPASGGPGIAAGPSGTPSDSAVEDGVPAGGRRVRRNLSHNPIPLIHLRWRGC
jgi:hypothetical protein